MTAYYNIHGEQLTLSARDAVVVVHPQAVATCEPMLDHMWVVCKSSHGSAARIGTGASEESAWRDAWSRMLAEQVEKEAP